MDLSIIIVNWNSSGYIRKCIQSIYENTKDMEYEVIIVDNASYDDCEKIVREEFPDVLYIQSKENIGFANANNLGFKYSKGAVLLFLNPDTEVVGSSIQTLFSSLKTISDAGAVGGTLLNSDHSLQTSCIQPYPTVLNQLLDIDYLKHLYPKLGLWGMTPLYCSADHPEEVEVISGACIMVKRNVFLAVQCFSNDYFMYAEDLDLCFKINRAGYKNYYVSQSTIIHHGGGSTKNKKESYYSVVMMRESVYRFICKTQGMLNARLYQLAMFIGAIVRLLTITLIIPFKFIFNKHYDPYYIYNKWRMVIRWCLGLENWAKDLSNQRFIN